MHPAGASLQGYYMPDYYVQPGLVGMTLLSSTAAASASHLTATFDVVLPARHQKHVTLLTGESLYQHHFRITQ